MSSPSPEPKPLFGGKKQLGGKKHRKTGKNMKKRVRKTAKKTTKKSSKRRSFFARLFRL